MKTYKLSIIFLLLPYFFNAQPVDDLSVYNNYTLKTNNVKTPTGANIESLEYNYSIYNGKIYYDWTSEYADAYMEAFEENPVNSNKVVRGEITKTYNCHSYAWNTCEGGNYVHWINARLDAQSSGNGNLAKYWASNGGYIQTTGMSTADKIYYPYGDHSARVISPSTGTVLSKWGNKLLVEHPYNDCPYDQTSLTYFKFDNPSIYGVSSSLCNNWQRTYSESKFTDVELDFNWDCASPLSEVSDDDNSSYIVEGTSQHGLGTISLTITTPSGATASASKSVWVGKPNSTTQTVFNIGEYGSGTPYLCPSSTELIYISISPETLRQSITNYDWDLLDGSGVSFQYDDNDNPEYVQTNSSFSYQRIGVKLYNACGWSDYHYNEHFTRGWDCGGYYMLFPNPADDYVEITTRASLENDNTNEATAAEIFEEGVVKIYNSFGNLLQTDEIETNWQRFSISNLKEGVYIVEISTKSRTERLQLVVKH